MKCCCVEILLMLLLVACNLPEVQECRAEKENSLQAWLPHACICIHLFHEKDAMLLLSSRGPPVGRGGVQLRPEL